MHGSHNLLLCTLKMVKGITQYTTPQVLEIVGISQRTRQVWIADGKVNKPGGQGAGRLWDVSEVMHYRNCRIKLHESNFKLFRIKINGCETPVERAPNTFDLGCRRDITGFIGRV